MKRLTEPDLYPEQNRPLGCMPPDTLQTVYALLRAIAAREHPHTDEEQPDDERAA